MGQILYPKWGGEWNKEGHTDMMIVTMIFTWHIAAVAVFTVLVGVAMYLLARKRYGVPLPKSEAGLANFLGKDGEGDAVGGLSGYKKLSQKEQQMTLSILTDDEDDLIFD